MEVKDGTDIKSSFDILDSFANALLTDSQFVQSYTATRSDVVNGALKLRMHASREPQNWSMVLTGPKGSATVSADINSDSFSALIDAIKASGTGLTAVDNGDGTLSISKEDASSKVDVTLKDISIEGYDSAQKKPKFYLEK